MIEYIKGELVELPPALAVVDCGGVGYGLNISLGTYSAIQGKRDVRLLVVEVVREDAYTLWGFATRGERELFLLLTSVSGIGASTARMVLSAMSPGELAGIIGGGDERTLRSIKGIGPKAAQRIIVELRDKVLGLEATASATASPGVDKELLQEAVAALTMLGFSPAPSHKVVAKLLAEAPATPIEQLIKKALKML